MPRYREIKKLILKDGSFLRKDDDELLKRWFWAGVAAAVQVVDKIEPLDLNK